MTCVAYRAGIMAADTMAEIVGLDVDAKLTNVKKIFRYRGHLIGSSGKAYPGDDIIREWFFEDEGEVQRPRLSGFQFTLLVVCPVGRITLWTHEGNGVDVNGPFFAIGSGDEIAIGAMAVGATAREAVKAAIQWSPGCGGKVYSLKW